MRPGTPSCRGDSEGRNADDVIAGAEFADLTGSTLTVHIAAGQSRASSVVDAINAQGAFTARLDPTDTAIADQAGFGLADVTATAVTSGGSVITFDQNAGLTVVNGGQT